MKRIFFFFFILLFMLQSCSLRRFDNFSQQKYTNFKTLKSKNEQPNQEPKQVSAYNVQLPEQDTFRVKNELASEIPANTLEKNVASESFEKETFDVSDPIQTVSAVQDYTNKTEKKENGFVKKKEGKKNVGVGWSWVLYSLLVLSGAFVIFFGIYTIVFGGLFVGSLLVTLGALLCALVLIHAILSFKKDKSKQRKALLIYASILCLGVLAGLIGLIVS
ncbi:DUF4407 domain-containing protein [Paracrocinitomix mangrovi]|uniref:DUF4407 domain-containing protein n=1 Tax=Paracrocinitomix mangrovi TaxID=2862509 RepID=UPI001C8DA92C|nr:DUF4407 domain-containing protein [Paracrocinitomix mangrovi]UKN03767.1 DUF4407 domain-containing protein [Paracrocinitomix mangrovi]